MLVAVVAFWLLATSGQPWHVFDKGPFTSNFYDAQAHALLGGHVDVPSDVALIEGFDVDGRTQLYFGIGPAVLRMPIALTGHWSDGRLTIASMLLAVGVLGLFSARLFCRARTAVGHDRERPWLVGVFAAAVALGTPVLFLASRAVVYHEAELWGAAAAVAGLDLALAWWREPVPRRLVPLAIVGAFALSCRPTSGSAPLLALGLFTLLLLLRRDWRPVVQAVVAGLLGVSTYVIVNLARFGQVASVPFALQRYSQVDAARKAALAANGGDLFGLNFAPTTLWHYLSPASISMEPTRLFPFVGWSGRATVFGGVTFDTIDRSSSLPLAAPLLCVLGVVGLWWIVRHDRGNGWRVVAAAAVLSTAATFTIGFIAQRYLVDLVPAVVVAAAPGTWVAATWLGRRSTGVRRALVALAVVVLVAGMVGQAALAVRGRYLYVVADDADRLDLIDLQYRIDNRLFGGTPPDVVAVSGSLPDPTDGTVALLDGCSGVYFGDGLQWHAIEWEAGRGRRLVLTPDDATSAALGRTPVKVATGPSWSITAVPTADGQVQLVYDGITGTDPVTIRSEPVDADLGTLDVVADPATTQIVVRRGDASLLTPYYVAADGLSAAPGWTAGSGPAPLCASLEARLPPTG